MEHILNEYLESHYKAQNSQISHRKMNNTQTNKTEGLKTSKKLHGGESSSNRNWNRSLLFLVQRDLILIGSAAWERSTSRFFLGASRLFLDHSLLHWVNTEVSPQREQCGQSTSAASTGRLTAAAPSNVTHSSFGHQVPHSYTKDLQGPTTVNTYYLS